MKHASFRRAPARAMLIALTALPGCGREDVAPAAPAAPATATATPVFTEQASALGLDFLHFNGMVGQYHFCEIMGAGVGVLDYDGDGDLDVYLLQGAVIDPAAPYVGVVTPAPTDAPRDRLYRNELAETGQLRFTDVTRASGLVSTGYGMGVAVGDYDGDGDGDLYVTNFGPNAMFRNNGDGTFTDVTSETGAGDDRWSTAAAFTDYDADGDLDLFVGNYVDYTVAGNKPCYRLSSARDYCSPLSFDAVPDRLLRNRGDGTFEDVSTASGIAAAYGATLGAIAADFNGDGRTDLYIANDGSANQLWVNTGDGRFRDEALLGGCAYNAQGRPEGSMGVAAGDFDDDGDEDLFMTHIAEESNTLFVNDGTGLFEDASARAGLELPSRGRTGFGTAWIDYDNDGRLDLLVVNGAVTKVAALVTENDPYPFHQPNQLYRNVGHGRFEECTNEGGAGLALSEVSRGAAFGDLDNDGDTDVLIANNNGPTRLLVNERGDGRAWLGLQVLSTHGQPAYGARVTATLANGRVLTRLVRADGSYCASNDPRVLLGLGDATAVDEVEVRWVNGRRERWPGSALPVNAYVTLREGSGERVE